MVQADDPPLKSGAARVQAALRELDANLDVREFPATTRTAADAAAAIGCSVGQIAKSLVFRAETSDRSVLVIACGTNRVNLERIAGLVGEPVGKADADYVRDMTGFAIGGVPPVAHATPPLTFIDEDLLQYDAIWAAAGTPNAVFRLTQDNLVRLTGGTVTTVA